MNPKSTFKINVSLLENVVGLFLCVRAIVDSPSIWSLIGFGELWLAGDVFVLLFSFV